MMRLPRTPRRGFTLVELLVAMGIILALTGLALTVVPDIMSQDRTTDGASLTRQYLMLSKSRASRDKAPRGLRLVVGLDPNNLEKKNALWVTEMQYIASPLVLLQRPWTDYPGQVGHTATYPPTITTTSPAIRFVYTTGNNGAITGRECRCMNFTAEGVAQIQGDLAQGRSPLLHLPVLGTYHKILAFTFVPGPNYYVATLDTNYSPWPDEQLGAGTDETTFHFGIYGAPQPLLGEPVLQLPAKICIDLASSSPSWVAAGGDFDILFSPSGQVISTPNVGGIGQINLWVRDYTKGGGSAGNYQMGGEQQFVSIKAKSGALGTFPIAWPPSSPFVFATTSANSP